MLPVRTVLHPTDFSENSELALQLAYGLARDFKAHLILLHVMPTPVVFYAGEVMPADTWPSREEVKDKLRQFESHIYHVRVESLVREGNPVDMILRTVEETGSDVIVMGTHGRTGLGRLLMGSVAESVLHKAPCPVLTVKSLANRKRVIEASEERAGAEVAMAAPSE